jgi:tRNA dimethylallyltransferase
VAHTYYVLTGPTAAGKTDWLIEHSVKVPNLAIAADSRQVYRHMDIGTGKPSSSDLKMLPHYGISILNPNKAHSVYQFLNTALAGFYQALAAGMVPWVLGGTGLYIRALVEELPLGSAPRPRLREGVERMLQQRRAADVCCELGLAPADKSNPVRVLRAVEMACTTPAATSRVYRYFGLEESDAAADEEAAGHDEPVDWDALGEWKCGGIAVLDPGREALSRRIKQRVKNMFTEGLEEEVAELRRLGYGDEAVVANGIGYREAGQLLDGALGRADAIERTIIRTRQYAKRQRTYFRGQGWPVMDAAQLSLWYGGLGLPGAS